MCNSISLSSGLKGIKGERTIKEAGSVNLVLEMGTALPVTEPYYSR